MRDASAADMVIDDSPCLDAATLRCEEIEPDAVVDALRRLAASGDRSGAVALYRNYESALAARGALPNDDVVAAYRAVLWDEPPAAAVRDDDELPIPSTPYYGRTRATALVAEAIATRGSFTTLLGPAGVGKTRLALAAAALARTRFTDGLRYVELLDDEDVAAQLRRAVRGDEDLDALFVLDNAEHVAEALREALVEVRRSHPRCAILVTSRVRIRADDEHVVEVAPFALPLAGAIVPVLARTPAVAFLIERAALARPDIRLDESTAPDVVALCTALDGLPLALELAAAQLRFFSLPELLRRIRGDRLVHVPLADAMRSSVELLDRDERRLFRRLAALEAPWTIAQAEAVCTDALLGPDEVVASTMRLLDRSLLQRELRDGVVRYRFLETTRRVALADDGDGEAERVRARAVAWCLDWMSADGLEGHPDVGTTAALDEHLELVRSVLDRWCTDPAAALRAIAATRKYWEWRGLAAESLARIDRLRSHAPALDDALAYAVGRSIATHGLRLGDNARTAEGIAASLAIAERTGDEQQRMEALHNDAILAYNRGDLERAVERLEELATVQLRRGLEADHARTTMNLAAIDLAHFAWDRAEERLASIAHVACGANEAVFVWRNRGYAAAMRGELVAARAFANEAARCAASRAVADEWRLELEHLLGVIALREGDPYRAIAHQQRALLVMRRPPFRLAMLPLEHAALAALEIAQTSHAVRLLAAVEATRSRLGLPRSAAYDAMFSEAHAKARGELGAAYAEEIAVGAALAQERATELAFSLPTCAPKTPRMAGLSERETEVAALVAEGATNRQIADRLVISVKTVENHIAAIFMKTGAKRRAQLAAYVREHELRA